MIVSEWSTVWASNSLYERWLPQRVDVTEVDAALDGITSYFAIHCDETTMPKLIEMTQLAIAVESSDTEESALSICHLEAGVTVQMRGNRVLVTLAHDFHPSDRQYYSMVQASEFLGFLKFIEEVAQLPKDSGLKEQPHIEVEFTALSEEAALRF